MKKLIGTLALSALAVSGFAQGTVVFNNSGTTGPVKQWTSTANSTLISSPKAVGTTANERVQLLAFYGSSTASLTPLFTQRAPNYTSLGAFLLANDGWTAYSTTGIGSLTAGVYNGGTLTVGVNDGVNGTSPDGANISYAILGWSGSAFTSFDAALAAAKLSPAASFLGISSIFTAKSGNPFSTPSPDPATLLSGSMLGLTLAPIVIPEPTSFALAGMGIAALLAFRRRS